LFYYRNRYYHPVLQRFISEDPIEFEGGEINLFSYVANSPTNFSDALGLTHLGCSGPFQAASPQPGHKCESPKPKSDPKPPKPPDPPKPAGPKPPPAYCVSYGAVGLGAVLDVAELFAYVAGVAASSGNIPGAVFAGAHAIGIGALGFYLFGSCLY
jgi:hypothetical protein